MEGRDQETRQKLMDALSGRLQRGEVAAKSAIDAMNAEMRTPVADRPKRELPADALVASAGNEGEQRSTGAARQVIDRDVEAWAKSMEERAKHRR
jgi:hypothetical protein